MKIWNKLKRYYLIAKFVVYFVQLKYYEEKRDVLKKKLEKKRLTHKEKIK